MFSGLARRCLACRLGLRGPPRGLLSGNLLARLLRGLTFELALARDLLTLFLGYRLPPETLLFERVHAGELFLLAHVRQLSWRRHRHWRVERHAPIFAAAARSRRDLDRRHVPLRRRPVEAD